MAKSKTLLGLCAGLLLLASAAMAQEKAWFDFEHCDMCKNFTGNPDLMKGMTCESHNVANGMMSVTIVKPELVASLREAMAKCNAMGEKLMAGEKFNLCGSCEAMGTLMARGAKYEEIELQNGGVMLLTSADAAVVADIHKWTDRTNEEMKKFMESQAAETK